MWTNQHGTGPDTNDMVETQVILQYMCQPYPQGKMATNDVNKEFEYHTIRNGQTLTTQSFSKNARENAYIRRDRGLHEPANYYQAYYRRERNKGKRFKQTEIPNWLIKNESRWVTLFIVMKLLFILQACSLLTKNLKVIYRFIRDRMLQGQGGAWRSLRNAITIHTGALPLGGTLLSWSAIKRPSNWWKNT